jgi:hypothetical protein
MALYCYAKALGPILRGAHESAERRQPEPPLHPGSLENAGRFSTSVSGCLPHERAALAHFPPGSASVTILVFDRYAVFHHEHKDR